MIRVELSLRLPNNAGALAGVWQLLADERVNVIAMALDASGWLRLVVDNHVRGAAALRERRHQVAERDVLMAAVPDTPGALAGVLRLVADAGVNVEYAYSGVGERALTASVVLGVDDVMRASMAAGL
ncbi:MAG TPA: ACT domain-containing protein [Vicinamibacterales bacterium]|nr:ACT domain-containing protein [Vicinamibacterales bacterium]